MNHQVTNVRQMISRFKFLDAISAGVFPLSALIALIALFSSSYIFMLATLIGYAYILTVRRYIDSRRTQLLSDLDQARKEGHIDEKEFRELIVTLNSLSSAK